MSQRQEGWEAHVVPTVHQAKLSDHLIRISGPSVSHLLAPKVHVGTKTNVTNGFRWLHASKPDRGLFHEGDWTMNQSMESPSLHRQPRTH